MEKFNIFSHIAERTAAKHLRRRGGPRQNREVHLFIKRFMDLFVMPNISGYLPQGTPPGTSCLKAGPGRTITTTEPKFVPDEPVEITFGRRTPGPRIRLVDCVGYTVAGAKDTWMKTDRGWCARLGLNTPFPSRKQQNWEPAG